MTISLGLWIAISTNIGAFAHAELTASNPVDGSIMQLAPTEISLTFGEELLTLGETSVNTVDLLGPDGAAVPLAPVVIVGATLTSKIEGDVSALSAGNYVISYRVVSADGHPVKGTVSFEVSAQESEVKTTPNPQPSTETQSAAVNLGFIAPFLIIVLIISALLLIRRRR